MLSRRGAFSQGHSMRLPPTHVGQQADDIPPHLQKLWQAHKAVATVKALSEISKPGGISRVGEFAFGMHLHPGNTAFGRQYARGLAEHGAGQKAQTSGPAPAKSKTPDKNPWGESAGEKQQAARRKTQVDKARLDEEKAQADHARNLETLKARAGLAASKTAPKSVQFSSTENQEVSHKTKGGGQQSGDQRYGAPRDEGDSPSEGERPDEEKYQRSVARHNEYLKKRAAMRPEQTPPSVGPKDKQPQLPLEYVKSEPKTGKGAFFAKHAEREKTWGDVNRRNPKDFIK